MRHDAEQTPDELRGFVQGYIDDVTSGRRVVGKYERLCVERHLRDLERQDESFQFDEDAALHILRFAVGHVRHTKGEWAGQRFRFCRQSAWIAFVLWSLFGWQRFDPDGR